MDQLIMILLQLCVIQRLDLSPIASELLRDLDKDTVLMSLNFDDTEYEPTVLPAAYPNLISQWIYWNISWICNRYSTT